MSNLETVAAQRDALAAKNRELALENARLKAELAKRAVHGEVPKASPPAVQTSRLPILGKRKGRP